MAALDDSLLKPPIEAATRAEIVGHLWPTENSTPLQLDDFDWSAYFHYYFEQCKQALRQRGRYAAARTHRDLVEVARYLEQAMPKDEIKQALRTKLPTAKSGSEDKSLEGSVMLGARIFLMMDIGVFQQAYCGRPPLVWVDGDLQTFLREYFAQPPVLGHENVKFEKVFKARNLEKIAGIRIEWTSNIADHLRMMQDDDKAVAIFHHASFLRWQNTSLFPDGLIEETLDTLALLFPSSDRETEKWFEKLSRSLLSSDSEVLDPKAIKCGQLREAKRRIENFRFWHDRLVILKQEFDKSRPATIQQWWVDRRNGVQWYTFWVAIVVLTLTIFFGAIQSIEGALQVYKAYHPTRP